LDGGEHEELRVPADVHEIAPRDDERVANHVWTLDLRREHGL
jgi:hypothetical protein